MIMNAKIAKIYHCYPDANSNFSRGNILVTLQHGLYLYRHRGGRRCTQHRGMDQKGKAFMGNWQCNEQGGFKSCYVY